MNENLAQILSGLNPSNVRIDSRGRIILTDKSLARQLREIGGDTLSDIEPNNGNCGCSAPE